ncbi:MAG: efflux transporter outer membrane subunit, partial [Casimicrobiaceae bacterium]
MRRPLIAVVAVALAGCVVGPDYRRPQTPLPAGFAGVPAADATVTPQAMPTGWWTVYDDPILDGLVASALAENLGVVAAVAKIEEFDADLREADAALFPEIDLGASAARSRSSGAVASPTPIRLGTDLRVALSTSFEI